MQGLEPHQGEPRSRQGDVKFEYSVLGLDPAFDNSKASGNLVECPADHISSPR
jgi:hypothetical protein